MERGTRTVLLALAGALTLGLAAGASAGALDRREHRQAERIRQGVRSGELTRHEADKLRREQAHIRAEEYRFRHDDGVLGPRERAKLDHDLDRASRDIRREKHDGQTR